MGHPKSDHCDGERFFFPGGGRQRGLLDILRWRLTSRAEPWPADVPTPPSLPLPARPGPEGAAATWIGHATFLIQAPGLTLIIDPVYSRRVGPVSWAGPTRALAPVPAFESLPGIDAVLLSHDHYDHCDLPTLRRLAAAGTPLVLAPLGHARLLGSGGVSSRVAEMDWWDTHALPGGASVTFTPSRHWCRRRPGDTNRRLWGGFLLRAGARTIYFAGDSGYDATLFREIGRRCGPPDLALVPIGAYEPRWFMSEAHMNPAEAVLAHRDVGARRSIGMHWGTFQLTDEGREAPVRALESARAAAGMTQAEFGVLQPGESTLL
jgi:L-ascorbate metabolism protein UlaG (beta-lactamase superfamily)